MEGGKEGGRERVKEGGKEGLVYLMSCACAFNPKDQLAHCPFLPALPPALPPSGAVPSNLRPRPQGLVEPARGEGRRRRRAPPARVHGRGRRRQC